MKNKKLLEFKGEKLQDSCWSKSNSDIVLVFESGFAFLETDEDMLSISEDFENMPREYIENNFSDKYIEKLKKYGIIKQNYCWLVNSVFKTDNGKIKSFKYPVSEYPKIQDVINHFYFDFSDLNEIISIKKEKTKNE